MVMQRHRDVQINRSITAQHHRRQQHRSTKMPYLVGKGVLRAIPGGQYKQWADTVPLFTKKLIPRAQAFETRDCRRSTPWFYAGQGTARSPATGATEFLTFVPTIYKRRYLASGLPGGVPRQGHDLEGLCSISTRARRPWSTYAAVGGRSAWRSRPRGDFKSEQGQHDQGPRSTRPSRIMIDLRRRHFRSFWTPSNSR